MKKIQQLNINFLSLNKKKEEKTHHHIFVSYTHSLSPSPSLKADYYKINFKQNN
jgi:hypothetical protein